MRTSDPAAYTDIAALTSGVALGLPFRGLLATTSASGACTFTITTVAGETKTLTMRLAANTSLIVPVSGSDVSFTGAGYNVYALI